MPTLIPDAPFPVDAERRYQVSLRERSRFTPVIDPRRMLDLVTEPVVTVTHVATEGELLLTVEFPLTGGRLEEVFSLARGAEGLRSRRLVRALYGTTGGRIRREEVDFADRTVPLPEASYPEVALPFLLGLTPFDGRLRDVYAWINDRFLARMQHLDQGSKKLELPGGARDAVKVEMFPDFNDWVHLGKVISRLVRPFLPKYHCWYEPEPPYALLRFEGPYGPPGAPEIVLERLPDAP